MRIAHLGLLSLALLGSFDLAAAANAADMNQPPRIVVSTQDLDLSTDAGVRAAQARVRRAAERVCDNYPRVGILPPAAVERCRMMAVREANARIVALASRRSDDGTVLASTARSMR